MRPGRAIVRIGARHDLALHATWLQGQADPETARRFLQAAQTTFVSLGESPGMGSVVPTRLPALADARKWRVQGFTDQLIFYHPRAKGGVEILRVLNAASDWSA